MTPRDTPRPKAESYSIQQLVERSSAGTLRVPDWQRLYQWQSKDMSLLLDSVTKGYPVGTLLLWKRPKPAPAGRIEIGPHAFDAPESSDAHWVIDGRQRLTTLAGVLIRRGPPDRAPDSRDKFTWAYDLATSKWINPHGDEAWRSEWLPADRLVDVTDLVTWLISHKDALTPPQVEQANAIGRNIREFQIPAIVVSASSDETLRVIFDRTNSAGKRLKKSETFDALQGAIAPEQPSTIRALALIPPELGFGVLPNDWLLRLVVQIGGGDMTTMSHATLERKDLSAALPRAAAALRRALVFVRTNVGIPNEALLPYRLPLVVVSMFFDKHPTPKARSVDLLSRWVWRGAETGKHRGQDIGEVRATLAAVGEDEEPTVQRLLATLPSSFRREAPPSAWRSTNLRSASTRLELLALVSLGPRHLDTGMPLDAAASIQVERVKALRRLLPDPQAPNKEGWSSLANRIVHPAAGASKLLKELAVAPAIIASSHAVSTLAQEALKDGDRDAFLLERSRELLSVLGAFLQARSRWSESTRPTIEQLLLPDLPSVG